MRSPAKFLLAVLLFVATGMLAYAQNQDSTSQAPSVSSQGATKDEVEQLRKQLAEQQKTIDQLKAMVDKLSVAKSQEDSTSATATGSNTPPLPNAPQLVDATFTLPGPAETSPVETSQKAPEKKDAPLATAGWNGEHFFLRSPDGTFTLLPVGYLNTQYTFYHGDGAPPETFSLRRARFGVQGTYGSKVDFAFLFDTTSTTGAPIRDMYLNFKPTPIFQVQAGQFKEPFSQEVGIADTNVEFLERSVINVLYPSAAGTFRAPGITAHGDVKGGVMQYWVGIFNGKGLVTNNTSNEPEVVGRLRFSPWKNHKKSFLQGFSFGGSIAHSRSVGLNGELSFSGLLNDNAYTFFPQFRINGGIERYNGEFLYLRGRWALRGEYTQILEKRDGLGSFTPGGIGFENIPGVVGKGGYLYTTYLVSGEREPENAIPRVKHPVIGPPTPGVDNSSPGWGAWQIKARYSWLEGKAGGQNFNSQFSPENVAPFSDRTDQISVGLNWYLNYWVLVKIDFNIDQLKNPSVQGLLPQNYFVALQGLQFRF